MLIVSAALFINSRKIMLIVGAALFINGRTNCPHENVDSWCSTIYKWCKLIVVHNICTPVDYHEFG